MAATIGITNAPRIFKKKIEKFGVIQQASQLLYYALGQACSRHPEHQAHFSLQPKYDLSNGLSSPAVRFSIGYTHRVLGGCRNESQDNIVWFFVKSIMNHANLGDNGKSSLILNDLTKTLKRQNENAFPQSTSKCRRKSIQFCTPTEPPTSSKGLAASNSLPLPNSVLDQALPDLCMRRNFCNQIQQYCHQSSDCCIGLLAKTNNCQHLVYSVAQRDGQSSDSTSSLISFICDRVRTSGLSIFERLHIAKLLAMTVLQFHATPWLKESWRSKDILMLNINPSPTVKVSLTNNLHLNVSVKGPNSVISTATTSSSRTIEPNPLLFGLGVIFLELAYKAPLRSKLLPIDLTDGREDCYTEFHMAKRLSKFGSTDMGLNYNNIVRKCLSCDLGHGDDLNHPELQAAFYRDVICELGSLEESLEKLGLGD
ncbi:MAG: hypothetical protein M1834_006578 [Cirrosporium novae-zelandiae]|nr:MAG: hypothetical protein M1834_006578 [Cirrosporium novae-zelandiae]